MTQTRIKLAAEHVAALIAERRKGAASYDPALIEHAGRLARTDDRPTLHLGPTP